MPSVAHYIVLETFTDQGLRAVKDTTQWGDAISAMGKKMGVTVKDIYWTLGQYDILLVAEAPDDAAATAFNLSIASGRNACTARG